MPSELFHIVSLFAVFLGHKKLWEKFQKFEKLLPNQILPY